MPLTRFTSPAEFQARVLPFLVEHEALNCLPLGLLAQLNSGIAFYEQPPYLALVEEAGRIVQVAMMTPPYRLVLSHNTGDEVETVRLIVRDVAEFQPPPPGVLGAKTLSGQFAREWQALTGQNYELGLAERVYQLEYVNPVAPVAGAMRRIGPNDLDIVARWLAEFNREALHLESSPDEIRPRLEKFLNIEERGTVVWEVDGTLVSTAGFSGPTPNGLRVVAVYTPPEYRGRGYASACVAALSRSILSRGKTRCFLFTDLSNPTSNHIYQEIGYQPVGDLDEYVFVTT